MSMRFSFLDCRGWWVSKQKLHLFRQAIVSVLPCLLFFTGCGGGDEDFGPTVIRDTNGANREPAVSEVVPKPAEVPPKADEKATGQAEVAGSSTPEPIAEGAVEEGPADVGSPVTADESETSSDKAVSLEPAAKVDRIDAAGYLARSENRYAVFAGTDRRDLLLFDQYTGQEISRFQYSTSDIISAVGISSDGSLVVAGFSNGSVKVFSSIDTRRLDLNAVRMMESAARDAEQVKGHDGSVTHIVILPDNERIVSAGVDGRIHLWSVGTGDFQESTIDSVRSFAAHNGEILSVEKARGDRLLSCGADGDIKLWTLDQTTDEHRVVASVGDSATAVSLSPDETTVVVAHGDGEIMLVPLDSGIEEGDGPLEDDSAPSAVVKKSSISGEKVEAIKHPGKVRSVSLSADSQMVMTGCDDGIVRIWELNTNKELEHTVAADAEIVTVGFPPANASRQFSRCVVSLDSSGNLRWWPSSANPRDTRRTKKLTRPVAKIELAEMSEADLRHDLTATSDTTDEDELRQRLHDELRTSESQESLVEIREAIQRGKSLQPSDGASGDGSKADTPAQSSSFDTRFEFQQVGNARSEAGLVQIEFSTDGTQLVAARQEKGSERQPQSTVHFWDLPTGIELRHWTGLPARSQFVRVVGNGQSVLTFPESTILNRSSGIASKFEYEAMELVRSPDGSRFVITQRGESQKLSPVIRLFDATTLEEIASFSAYEAYVTATAFSSDGKELVACVRERKAHKLVALDAESLQELQIIEEHGHADSWLQADSIVGSKAVTLILFSSDARRVLTYGEYERGNFRVSLWESRNGKRVELDDRRVESRKRLIRSDVNFPASFLDARGTRLILAGEKGYTILDLDEERQEREIEIDASAFENRTAVSSDGALLAVGTERGKVQIWQLDKERPMLEYAAHLGPVVSLRFSPDGSQLATIGEENTLNVWNLAEWSRLSRRVAKK